MKKWLISVFNPPYQLALSEKIFDNEKGHTFYVFKQYGSHDYIKVTYFDILNNCSMLSAINPIHLMDIHLHEYILKEKNDKYRVTETLRNNLYKIANPKASEIYSGEHICKNIDMFSTVSHEDICKIAYKSGFIKGRKLSVEIKNLISGQDNTLGQMVNTEESTNIINLDSYRTNSRN